MIQITKNITNFERKQHRYCSLIYKEEGSEDVTLNAGDTYIVAPNVMHGIECLTNVKLLDIFTPMREDFV